ncbi:hypothetical protein lerEdw1_000156 [Lerista edwardsae]|nr:hypothetical protein lerEdw1_000156 [Lerista edwardsae]
MLSKIIKDLPDSLVVGTCGLFFYMDDFRSGMFGVKCRVPSSVILHSGFWYKTAMKTLVIGLGGVTNGGKTTLTRRLEKLLPNCSIISQDDFFKPESEVAIDDRGFLQYDVLDALHMEEMVASIRSWMTRSEDSAVTTQPNSLDSNQKGTEEVHVLIVEGFLLYNYRPLSDVWNKKYFLTIPYEECKRRRRNSCCASEVAIFLRSSRIYNPPDPPGYFDGHVWPMYLKHKKEMEESETDIVYLDGTKSQDDICSRIYNDIVQEWKRTSEQSSVKHL